HQAKNVKIEIIDLSGRLMHQSNWDSFGGRQSIDISKLANGTYVVRVKEGNKLSEQKLVVQ
nr:T9SS type A sorting domain-containing protein [Saprospiraceae bacterium]